MYISFCTESVRERSHMEFVRNHRSFIQSSQSVESLVMTPVASGSDVEDDTDNDEEEIFLPSALNIPNSIPFTHARKGVLSASWREAQDQQMRFVPGPSPTFVIPEDAEYPRPPPPNADLRYPQNEMAQNPTTASAIEHQFDDESSAKTPTASYESPMSIPSADLPPKLL